MRRVSTAAARVTRLAAQAMGRDLAEADWWRLLDALLLIAAHQSVRVSALRTQRV